MTEKFAGISLQRKIVMGIINLSSETFYEKSLAEDAERAAGRAAEMVDEGAQIIDLGAMSTGPKVEPISTEEELKKLIPVVEAVEKEVNVPISIDTQRAIVAEKALRAGADIINDVSGFKADPQMPETAASFECPAILMASRISGRIRTAEKGRKDIENMGEIEKGLKESLKICDKHGVNRDKMAIDPGIGFGRGKEWDLKVLDRLGELREFDLPICIGISRKSFVGNVLGLENPSDRLIGSLGATAVAVMKGADIVRTHDPLETTQLVRMIEAIKNAN